ncbi:flagellar biosynthetic protein FliR [Aquabacter sp. L1I39]|uniref:flagellar biosynthetic protein FliR n=1 Tax=Aquabacter sp. L1I39 TaxID=2820278 RepID=UPI002111F70D|nr:flagellar biosynthetic protein FliR [Aquabacter sp. L1I39]
MLLPGIGGRHLPVQVRLFLAVAISLAFSPMLANEMGGVASPSNAVGFVMSVTSEVAIGAGIGLLARVFFLALQTMANAIAQAIGVAGMPGLPLEDDEPLPAIATLIAFSATTLLFASDLHLELIKGIFESYRRIPPSASFTLRFALPDLVDQLTAAYLLAVRLSSPFIIYSIVANLAVGIANKFTPQIPVYFVATPFVMAGGLLLLYMIADSFLGNFIQVVGAWLKGG